MSAIQHHSFDPALVSAVQGSFTPVMARADEVGRVFYETLFAADPSLRAMFPDDMARQRESLVDTLNVMVCALDHLESVLPIARDLAVRHVGYGVRPAHYALVGRALIQTLETVLGPHAFDAYTRTAWRRTYGALAAVMLAAGYPEDAGGDPG